MPGLTILPAAQRDLIEIGDFIALDNPARARDFVAEIEQTIVSKIAVRPLSFPGREDVLSGLRAATHGRYLIFFMVIIDEIKIVRILHSARDFKQIFDT